jgi:hypothetical protein
MAKAAGMGDKEAEEWLQAHCPQKPEWLQKLVDENATSRAFGLLVGLPLSNLNCD